MYQLQHYEDRKVKEFSSLEEVRLYLERAFNKVYALVSPDEEPIVFKFLTSDLPKFATAQRDYKVLYWGINPYALQIDIFCPIFFAFSARLVLDQVQSASERI